jgi:hypothetical protein
MRLAVSAVVISTTTHDMACRVDAEQKAMSTQPSSAIERPRALTIEQFCARYAVGRTTAKELIRDKTLIRRYVGRRSLIDFDSAETWWNGLPTDSASARKTSANLPDNKGRKAKLGRAA